MLYIVKKKWLSSDVNFFPFSIISKKRMILCLLIFALFTMPNYDNRPRSMVCNKFKSDYEQRAKSPFWTGDAQTCDNGIHSEDDKEDTTRRINLFRYLCGFEQNIVLNRTFDLQCAEAATNMDRNSRLSHTPESSSLCYTAGAYTAASTSNLALGTQSSAQTIDLYINDNGVASLGHRRWVLHNTNSQYGLGFRRRAGVMKVIGVLKNPSYSPLFVAYPGPGPFPIKLIYRQWSIHANGLTSNSTVTLTRNDGINIPITVDFAYLTYGGTPNMIQWRANNVSMISKEYSYQVNINNGINIWRYTVRPTDCDDNIADSDFNKDTLPIPTDPLYAERVASTIGGIFFGIAVLTAIGAWIFTSFQNYFINQEETSKNVTNKSIKSKNQKRDV